MKTIALHSILIALAAGFVHQRADAQAANPAPDSVNSVRRAPPSTVSAGRRNYLLPALEVPGFLAMLSLADRALYPDMMQDGKRVYSSTWQSTKEHLRDQNWVHDQDPFDVNQFQHPYQGAIMFGLARSTGHGFWTSLIYSNIGSFIWKMAGETDPPSIDDAITTGQAGSLLGEALFRTSNMVLKDHSTAGGRKWKGFFADLIYPPRAFNRHIFGNDFRNGMPDSVPAMSWQLGIGAARDAFARDYASPVTLLRQDATADIKLIYGMPGRIGYNYHRPLSYFDLQVSILFNSTNPVENVMLRGLLAGGSTSARGNARGIWGLYGSYDYISPYLFRVSSTALSVGTTRQQWVGRDVAIQSSLLAGVGYGAAGSTTVIPSTPTNAAIRDYHYGVTPQGLGAVRLIAYDRVLLDVTAREFYISGLGSDDTKGSETIFRGDAGISIRIVGGHALGAKFVMSTRDARYGVLADKRLTEQTVSLVYSFLGNNSFSAVKWQ